MGSFPHSNPSKRQVPSPLSPLQNPEYVTPLFVKCNPTYNPTPKNRAFFAPLPHPTPAAIQSTFEPHSNRASTKPIKAPNTRSNRFTQGFTVCTQKRSQVQPHSLTDVNQTQTCASVYAIKIKPKLNQCKRFVLCSPTQQTNLTN